MPKVILHADDGETVNPAIGDDSDSVDLAKEGDVELRRNTVLTMSGEPEDLPEAARRNTTLTVIGGDTDPEHLQGPSRRRGNSAPPPLPKRAWGAQRGSKGTSAVYIPNLEPTGFALYFRNFSKWVQGSISEERDIGTIPADPSSGSVVESLKKDDRERQKKLVRQLYETAVVYSDRKGFNLAMGVLTLVNLVTIGLETDYDPQSLAGRVFSICNYMFLLIYIVELIFRYIMKGLYLFTEGLSYIDMVVALFPLFERVTSDEKVMRSLPVFRLLRLIKVLHSVGVFNWSRTGQNIVMTARCMIKTLGWTLLALAAVVWSAAAFSHVVIGKSGEWSNKHDPREVDVSFSRWDNTEYFGTFQLSFMTILQIVTTSQWATEVARPVLKVYPVLPFFFIFLILSTAYGLLLCVISVFVQNCLMSSQHQAALKRLQEKEAREKVAGEILALINLLDQDSDGQLDLEELEGAFQNEKIKERLLAIGVPENVTAQGLMHWLDRSCDGKVSFEEFEDGLVVLEDEVKPNDFIKLYLWLNATSERLTLLEKRMISLQLLFSELQNKFVDAVDAVKAWIAKKDYKDYLADIVKRSRSPEALKANLPKLTESIHTKRLRKIHENVDDSFAAQEAMSKIKGLVRLPVRPRVRQPFRGLPSTIADDDDEVHVLPPQSEAPLLQGSLRAAGASRASPQRNLLPSAAPLVNEAARAAMAKRKSENTQAADKDIYSGLGPLETIKDGSVLKKRLKELI